MKYSMSYDENTSLIYDVALIPEDKEDINKLYNYAQVLNVLNPALIYTEVVKKGDRDKISDEDFIRELEGIKGICDEFFKKDKYKNIFELNVAFMRYLIENPPATPKYSRVEQFLKNNGIFGNSRRLFYKFISKPYLRPSKEPNGKYKDASVDGMPVTFRVPTQWRTYYIIKRDKVQVVCTFNPVNTWLVCDDDNYAFNIDVDSVFTQAGVETSKESRERLSKDTAIIQKLSYTSDIFEDKKVELYVYKDYSGDEHIEYIGELAPMDITVDGGKEPDFFMMALTTAASHKDTDNGNK